MLFPGRAETNPTVDAIVVNPHHKAVDKPYFCPNLSCLSDDLLVRKTSSFRNVWLVTELATDSTWLTRAVQPSCPHCDSPLCIDDETINDQNAIEYAVADYLLSDYAQEINRSVDIINEFPLM